jgi:hypothetical protein
MADAVDLKHVVEIYRRFDASRRHLWNTEGFAYSPALQAQAAALELRVRNHASAGLFYLRAAELTGDARDKARWLYYAQLYGIADQNGFRTQKSIQYQKNRLVEMDVNAPSKFVNLAELHIEAREFAEAAICYAEAATRAAMPVEYAALRGAAIKNMKVRHVPNFAILQLPNTSKTPLFADLGV